MENNIERQLDEYEKVFDFYIDRGTLPDNAQDDPLARYLKNVLDEPSNKHLCQTDDAWKEILKKNLLDFFAHLLPLFNALEEEKQKEIRRARLFLAAHIEEKRRLWSEIDTHIRRLYSPAQINMDGYLYLFQQSDKPKEAIFSTLAHDWEKAAAQRCDTAKEKLLTDHKKTFEQWTVNAGKTDYETISKSASVVARNPVLQEILHLMGREQKSDDTRDYDSTVIKYIPLLLSHAPSREEIEGVCAGHNLAQLLPAEIALLSDPRTELLFYRKYAVDQLLSFSNRPPVRKQEKTETKTRPRPRLAEGPIIVCVDTSGSMRGKPERIAKALLLQCLQTAKRKKRKCYLITYSVRARALEISRPNHWRQLDDFLKEDFTGGTDGEMMFDHALGALDTDPFSMADVLVISDFIFQYPCEQTEKRIKAVQQKGTRFYGLRIHSRGTNHKYDKLFDKIWQI